MGDTTVKFEPETGTPGYYEWQVADKGVSVLIDYDVVDRLLAETMRGFGAVPRRGAEVGGVLLGTAVLSETLAVKIDDFETVPVSYSRGPSYLLSPDDRQAFQKTVERWQPSESRRIYAVGFFRSHTRDGLGLSPEDLELFSNFFQNPTDVVLLMKPFIAKPSQAGFFFREGNGMRTESSYLEFPFRRKELGGGESPRPRREESSADEVPVSEAPSPAPESAPERPVFSSFMSEPKKRKANFWIPLSFIFLIIGVLLGFQAGMITTRGRTQAQSFEDSYALDLTVKKDGDAMSLKWNRQAPILKKAQRGVLTINDGQYSNTVKIEGADLQAGGLVYKNVSDTVKFRFEIFTSDRNSLVETLDFPEKK